MNLLAILAGVLCGGAIVAIMFLTGMLRERSGAAMLLAAIAVFYPVFAASDGHLTSFVLHALIFVGFAALAVRAFKIGLHLIAGGLIAHGLFDVAAGVSVTPGPDWWPAFCASLDLTAGVIILRLIQLRKVPQ